VKVLVLCEFSGVVREAFRKRGHDAWSCDLRPCELGATRHLQVDAFEALVTGLDLIIMHPPCTALAVSGNRWYGRGMPKHQERLDSIKWTLGLWDKAVRTGARVCMENPVGVLPIKPTQYIQPWQFGHGETKKTGLWLRSLPELKPTKVVEGREQRILKMGPSPDREKLRSITYQGIADAMAEQWG